MTIGRGAKTHFSRVAPVYTRLRNTDPEIVETIASRFPQRDHIELADVGCGTGRYSALILDHLNGNARMFCCDASEEMLMQCRQTLRQTMIGKHVEFVQTSADNLPMADNSLDAVVTFNAVHHFDLEPFVREAARVLSPGGVLAIYTRTPEQNARTIWGQHFPGFNEYERRLYTRKQLEGAIRPVAALKLDSVQEFSFRRSEPTDILKERARHHHYSTFALYPAEEFERAFAAFEQTLAGLTNGSDSVSHSAENTLVLARKQS